MSDVGGEVLWDARAASDVGGEVLWDARAVSDVGGEVLWDARAASDVGGEVTLPAARGARRLGRVRDAQPTRAEPRAGRSPSTAEHVGEHRGGGASLFEFP